MKDGSYTWLPFLGSQLWDWEVCGTSQKFSGFVPEPAYGKNYLENYGGFLIHCGLTAMGNPTDADHHPQHGELPIARFSTAWIEIDVSDKEFPITLCSQYIFHVPFIASYTFTPKLHLHQSGKAAWMDGIVTNTAKTAFRYMYLAHINFAYPNYGTLNYRIGEVTEDSIDVLPHLSTFHPKESKQLDASMEFDPEFVAIIHHHEKDALPPGAHPRYVLHTLDRQDDTSVWVASELYPLDHTVLWVTKTPDRSACGFSLPSTAGPTGVSSETAKGNIKELAPGKTVHLRYAFGLSPIDATDSAAIVSRIFI